MRDCGDIKANFVQVCLWNERTSLIEASGAAYLACIKHLTAYMLDASKSTLRMRLWL